MPKIFESHGRMRVYTFGQVFVSEVEGPWNIELTQRWIRELGPHVLNLARNGATAGISVFSGSMLCTPESLELIGRASRETAKVVNIVAMAHVATPDVEARDLMQRYFETQARDLYEVRLFEEFGAARNWVEGALLAPRDDLDG